MRGDARAQGGGAEQSKREEGRGEGEAGRARAAQQRGGGGAQGRWGKRGKEAEVFRAGGSRPPRRVQSSRGVGPRGTHITLVGHPPLLHVQHASPPRCCAAAAWPLLRGPGAGGGAGRAAAGREPGAGRDQGPGRARAAAAAAALRLRSPSGPAAAAAAPPPGPPRPAPALPARAPLQGARPPLPPPRGPGWPTSGRRGAFVPALRPAAGGRDGHGSALRS